MAGHKLPAGKKLIEGIANLGMVLGYYIEKEFPVQEPTYGESPAVDVAWFSQKGNRFPLFIFEVESKATNGMTNNPLKIYAQENRAFEKPLFFFHVVAQGGGHSGRPRNLEAQYGKNNYRIYLVENDAANDLIQDVLSQHARVRNDVNYLALHQLLMAELWLNKVNSNQLLMHAVKLGLSKENAISSYIRISRYDSSFFSDFVELVKEDSKNDFANTVLDSCIGAQWCIPIIAALLCGLSEAAEHWSSVLLDWQKDSSYLPMITPAFGLSRDYDEFILGCAPQLMTLCIAVSSGNGDFYHEFVGVLAETLDKVGVCWAGLNSAIYLLHISAAFDLDVYFKKAKNYLLEFKEFSEENIFHPPSCVSVFDGNFEDYFLSGEVTYISEINQFTEQCKKRFHKEIVDVVGVALRALDDDSYVHEWSTDLLEVLWSKLGNRRS